MQTERILPGKETVRYLLLPEVDARKIAAGGYNKRASAAYRRTGAGEDEEFADRMPLCARRRTRASRWRTMTLPGKVQYLLVFVTVVAASIGLELSARRRPDPVAARNVGFVPLAGALPLALAFAVRSLSSRIPGPGVRREGWTGDILALAAAGTGAALATRLLFSRLLPAGADVEEPVYNYAHFAYEYYAPSGGPRGLPAGSRVPDDTVYDQSGRPVRLGELYRKRPIVLEFGSVSCPQFVRKIGAMDRLADDYRGLADFYVLYTREAHPGPNFPRISSMEQKLRHSGELAELDGETRKVLVDDVEGTVHQRYGGWPNSILIISRDGVLAFRSEWNEPEKTGAHPNRLLENEGIGASVSPVQVDNNLTPPTELPKFIGLFLRPGFVALADFLLALPRMALVRLRTGGFARR